MDGITKNLYPEFSPPYGDGTASRFDMTDSNEFSPPYGDGTGSLQCSIRKEKVFAPLRGWYLMENFMLNVMDVFAPLRGWYQKKMYYRRYEYVFAPLRGWYRNCYDKHSFV